MEPRERLKIIREEKGFTQTKMAEMLRMQLTSYNHIERGKNKISPRVSLLIELLLGISEEWLLEGKGEKFVKLGKEEYPDFNDNQSVVDEPEIPYSKIYEYKLEADDFKNQETVERKFNDLVQNFWDLKVENERFKKIIDKLLIQQKASQD